MTQARVLCISFDKSVSNSRCSALTQAGYEVVATTTSSEALDLLRKQKFQAVVVGHRFAKSEKTQIAAEAKTRTVPVVLVCGMSGDTDVPADMRVSALDGTDALLKAVASALAKQAA